jgi:hypothetical protein
MKYFLCALLIGLGAYATEKSYPVSHTVPEWTKQIQGLAEVQRVIHTSGLPAHEAFYCDSVLQSIYMDINRQVVAGINADTTKTKK